MKKVSRRRASAERIARAADRGEDVTRFFAGKGRMMAPLPRPDVQRVNVDFTIEMLGELDAEAHRLNISRQAVIKTMLSRALDERRGTVRIAPRKKHDLEAPTRVTTRTPAPETSGVLRRRKRARGAKK
jgi:hypothetical protein